MRLILSVFAATFSVHAATFPTVQLQPVVTSGLSDPIHVTHAGDGSGRLFICERSGRIRIVRNGVIAGTFLDIDDRVKGGNEQGLLSVAFPSDFVTKKYFYVYYITDASGENNDTRVSRFHVTGPNLDDADEASEEILLRVDQDFSNHNGGQLCFSPIDGFLYVFLGDGGSGNDPNRRAQNGQSLLGKILRIDVEGTPDAGLAYAIPPGNPFVNNGNFRNEIWAYGLRNPWRASFDSKSGDLYIGDVGQNAVEEVDFQPASSSGGENYGWRKFEGTRLNFNGDPAIPDPFDPAFEYNQSGIGRSITGGVVHRGTEEWKPIHGTYFFADYLGSNSQRPLMGLKQVGGAWMNTTFFTTNHSITSFGEGEDGEVYCVALNTDDLLRIVDTTVFTDTDGDLMPDEFEDFYGLDKRNREDGGIDTDLDGMVNSNEFVAGTSPTNMNEVLEVVAPEIETDGDVVIRWPSVRGRLYDVRVLDLDNPGGFTSVAADLPATPPQNSFTDVAPAADRRVYQVVVKPAP